MHSKLLLMTAGLAAMAVGASVPYLGTAVASSALTPSAERVAVVLRDGSENPAPAITAKRSHLMRVGTPAHAKLLLDVDGTKALWTYDPLTRHFRRLSTSSPEIGSAVYVSTSAVTVLKTSGAWVASSAWTTMRKATATLRTANGGLVSEATPKFRKKRTVTTTTAATSTTAQAVSTTVTAQRPNSTTTPLATTTTAAPHPTTTVPRTTTTTTVPRTTTTTVPRTTTTTTTTTPTTTTVPASGTPYPVGTADSSEPSGLAPPGSNAMPGYAQSYVNDFNGSSLPSGWQLFNGTASGDVGSQWAPSHVTVGSGLLQMNTYQDANYGNAWVTGGVCQCGNGVSGQTYGAYFVRSRTTGPGPTVVQLLWPANNSWPPEIDFNETYGLTTATSATLHYNSANAQVQRSLTIDMTQWHTFGVIWTPSSLTYTVDGQVWGTVDIPADIPNVPMTLDIDQQTWCNSGFACPTAPESLLVDWVAEYSAN